MESNLNCKVLSLFSIFFITIFINGCLPPPEQWEDIESDYDHVLNVLGILSLDSETDSFIGLYRTTDLDEQFMVFVGVDTIWFGDDYFLDSIYEPAALIQDATIQISDGTDTFDFNFVESEDFYSMFEFQVNLYKDTTGTFQPQPNVNYTLFIEAEGFDPVSGSLTTPNFPQLIDSMIVDTIQSRSTFEIHWNPFDDTTRGFLHGSVQADYYWEEGKNWCRDSFDRVVRLSDGIYTVPTELCDETQDDNLVSDDYFIRLIAMDDNYFNYFVRGEIEDYSNMFVNSSITKGRSVGIEGGFGVFGAIASDGLYRIVIP